MGSCVPANEVHELNFAQLERTGYPDNLIQVNSTQQVVAYRPALREPRKHINPALQPLSIVNYCLRATPYLDPFA